LDDDVRWLGWIDQADLEGLYACSELLVFPSLYEGFGLPVLEALLRGLPVACSDRGSLAEIAGDAALIFDPEDPAAIAAAVRELHDHAELRTRLMDAGRAQAARYTWSACAAGYVRSFQRTLAD
jgi:glycosyltransferase involved in cell wall biosynthesis